MAVRLFVGNLPYTVTEAELREHFSAVGPLSHVYLPSDRETGKLRGFAFIEFDDAALAEEAIGRFNDQMFKGRPLAVKEARAKDDRPRSAAPSRPPSLRPGSPPPSYPADPPQRGGEIGRNFGPDSAPRRSKSKSKGGQRSERVPKGPMREITRGQFFGGEDDDLYDDDLDGENFASRVEYSEEDDQ